jgi:hypothetical protein
MKTSTNKKIAGDNSLETLGSREMPIFEFVQAYEEYYQSDRRDRSKILAALDALTIAHMAETFEWAAGPHRR